MNTEKVSARVPKYLKEFVRRRQGTESQIIRKALERYYKHIREVEREGEKMQAKRKDEFNRTLNKLENMFGPSDFVHKVDLLILISIAKGMLQSEKATNEERDAWVRDAHYFLSELDKEKNRSGS